MIKGRFSPRAIVSVLVIAFTELIIIVGIIIVIVIFIKCEGLQFCFHF